MTWPEQELHSLRGRVIRSQDRVWKRKSKDTFQLTHSHLPRGSELSSRLSFPSLSSLAGLCMKERGARSQGTASHQDLPPGTEKGTGRQKVETPHLPPAAYWANSLKMRSFSSFPVSSRCNSTHLRDGQVHNV